MLWAVDGGQSFQVVCVALICFGHGFIAFYILFRSTYDELKYGMLVSGTAVLSLVLLTQSVYWGQQATLIDSLSHDSGSTHAFYERNSECDKGNVTTCTNFKYCTWTPFNVCQRTMKVDTSAKAKFNSVTAFSVLLSLTHALFTYLLISWKDEFGNVFGGPRISARAATNTSHLSSDFRSQVPAAAHAQDFDAATNSYQTADDDRL